ncbi:cytochrome P450 [Xylogone sp. PMI_703]|nr:cytochrome P450 [Xylogone sp. PMI_703]
MDPTFLSNLSILEILFPLPIVYLLLYVIYQRYFHPLAKYPGPFLNSLTDLAKFSYFWSLDIDKKIEKLHQKYGPVVRIAPNELSFWGPNAVAPIYKSGRTMIKSRFFDGFTTFKPNLFGTRDEDLHALRRRQMAHGFSTASLVAMEPIFDRHIRNLRKKLNVCSESGSEFDLKRLFAFYTYDILGQLAFSADFNSQQRDDDKLLPPINDHILLGSLYGALPSLLPYSMKFATYLPIPWVQGLIRNRLKIRNTVTKCVADELEAKKSNDCTKTLLSQLIAAKDPETGEKLTPVDISSEAFGFLVAGSHTTSGTLTLLFYHLLHHPEVYQRLKEELDQKLEYCLDGSYSFTGLESKLPYTMACIRENFRLTPVFTMPLTRTVVPENGIEVDGCLLPRGTNASICNYALHHNPEIWGPDHNTFDPSRWLSEGYAKDKLNYLMPFGMGHRMCIGRNIATINVLKALTALIRCYEFEAVDMEEELKVVTVGIGEKEGPLLCRVKARKE